MAKKCAGSAAVSSIPDEGARTALSGYLFQIVGVLGFRAMVDDVQLRATGLEAYFTLVRTGTLSSEQLGQDAVITGGLGAEHERVLVQFKHSATHPPKNIVESDLLDVLRGFEKSAKAARGSGLPAGGYLLVTNRQLGGGASAMIQQAKAGQLDPRFPRNKTRAETYRRMQGQLLDRPRNKVVAAYGGRSNLSGRAEAVTSRARRS